mmetsp:Transcript_3646/g.8643  ORF Transcript_3646/g.8643 Transcript_3646/m.8643 type:complete len:131 (+) Transcript_3646:213-605(+)
MIKIPRDSFAGDEFETTHALISVTQRKNTIGGRNCRGAWLAQIEANQSIIGQQRHDCPPDSSFFSKFCLKGSLPSLTLTLNFLYFFPRDIFFSSVIGELRGSAFKLALPEAVAHFKPDKRALILEALRKK